MEARPDTQERTDSKRSARGRKDAAVEAAIKTEALAVAVDELVKLYKAHQETGEQLNDGVKAIAKRSGLLAVNVSAFIRARASDDFDDRAQKAIQLALVFEEVGQVKAA